MSKLHRYYQLGQTYFVTSVTFRREPILLVYRQLFYLALAEARKRVNFNVSAWVLLPDHFHLIMTPLEQSPCEIMRRIKLIFAFQYRRQHALYRGRVWQPRFWDRVIRNEADFQTHAEYIHQNPVKHGYATNPFHWIDSSIHQLEHYVGAPEIGLRVTASFDGLKFGE